MITTLKPTSHQPPYTTAVTSSAPVSSALAVPETPSHQVMPFAIGALLGLLVVVALVVWTYLVVSNAEYADVIDLTQALAR